MTDPSSTARELLVMAEGAINGTRREGERELPLGERARRTRNALLKGAWDVFCEKGFRATQPGDIAARAGTGVGTFYQYFRSRSDVMSVLVAILVKAHVGDAERSLRIESGPERLWKAIDGYVRGYHATAAFQAAWDEAAQADEDLASVRRAFAAWLIGGVEAQLRRGQELGSVRGDLDPATTARALTVMLDRYCYQSFVFDPLDPPLPLEDSVRTLVAIWSSAIGWPRPGDDGRAENLATTQHV